MNWISYWQVRFSKTKCKDITARVGQLESNVGTEPAEEQTIEFPQQIDSELDNLEIIPQEDIQDPHHQKLQLNELEKK